MQSPPRPGLLSLFSFSISACLSLLGIGLPMLGVTSHLLGLGIMILATTFFIVSVITGVAWFLSLARGARVSGTSTAPERANAETGSTAGVYREAVGETRRDPRQVEEETDEEFLMRRCIEVEQELTKFWQRHQYITDPNEFVAAFKKRQERKVNGLRQRIDGQGWLTAQERDALTLRPGDGPEKIEQIIFTLRKIGEGG